MSSFKTPCVASSLRGHLSIRIIAKWSLHLKAGMIKGLILPWQKNEESFYALPGWFVFIIYAVAACLCFLAWIKALIPPMIGQTIMMINMTGSFAIVRKGFLSIRLSIKIPPQAPAKVKSALKTAISNGFDLMVFLLYSPLQMFLFFSDVSIAKEVSQ